MERLTPCVTLIAFMGCLSEYPYILRDGTTVHCKTALPNACGWSLLDCQEGSEFYCQTNIERPIKYPRPTPTPTPEEGPKAAV